MREMYTRQARLLFSVLECLECDRPEGTPFFALNGGTALNFFVQPFPRLSVDIDLAYCPLDARDVALSSIGDGLQRLAAALHTRLPGVVCSHTQPAGGDKLLVRHDGTLPSC